MGHLNVSLLLRSTTREADVCFRASQLEEDDDIVEISGLEWTTNELIEDVKNYDLYKQRGGKTDGDDLFLAFRYIKMATHIDPQIDRIDISNEYRRLYLESETVVGETWFLFKNIYRRLRTDR